MNDDLTFLGIDKPNRSFCWTSLMIVAVLLITGPVVEAAGNVGVANVAGVLTINGDNLDNSLVITVTPAGMLTITGQAGTLVNGAASYAQPYGGSVTANIDLRGGNDSLVIDRVNLTCPTLNLGSGNDIVNITTSTVVITTLDGGTGSDSFRMRNCSLRIRTLRNFP